MTPATAPGDSSVTTAPGDSSVTPATAPGDSLVTPATAPGDFSVTTAPGDSPPTTAPGDSPPTTAPGDSSLTTAPGDSSLTTAPGDSPPTTAPGDFSLTPTTAPRDSPLTTAPGDSPLTTAPGDSSLTTAPGDSPPTTAPGDSSLTPTTAPGDSPVTCPPWYLPSEASSGDPQQCYCSDVLKNIVQCEGRNQTSYLLLHYCMTYEESTSTVLVGVCPYSKVASVVRGFWNMLPVNVSQIDACLCGSQNRRGLLCGQCMEGHGISVHSGNLACVNCSQHPHGWAWFLFTEIILQTLFFMVIFTFRISVTTAKFNGFLFVCQIISFTHVDRFLPEYLKQIGLTHISNLSRVSIGFLRIWVLEFFTSELPTACLAENLSALGAVALKYVSAFYPFLLIFFAFLIHSLHDCNYRPVSILLRPCKSLQLKLNQYFDFKRSLIHTFSATVVLSYSKFALVSFSLLFPTKLYNASGAVVYDKRWYHDAEVELFGSEHLPYGILALVILLSFVFTPPLMLFLYPFKFFRRLLHKLKMDSPGLSAFMDSFQGCYRDGTDASGGRDMRCFAALYFVLRLLFISVRLLTLYQVQWNIMLLLFVSTAILFSYASPYKRKICNLIDVGFLCLLSLQFFLYSTLFTYSSLTWQCQKQLATLLVMLSLIPLLYFSALVLWQVMVSVRALKRWGKWYSKFLLHYRVQKEQRRNKYPLSEWPQRLLEDLDKENSETY